MLIESPYVILFDGSTNVGLSPCVTLFDDNTNVGLSPFYGRNVYNIDPDFRMGQGQPYGCNGNVDPNSYHFRDIYIRSVYDFDLDC